MLISKCPNTSSNPSRTNHNPSSRSSKSIRIRIEKNFKVTNAELPRLTRLSCTSQALSLLSPQLLQKSTSLATLRSPLKKLSSKSKKKCYTVLRFTTLILHKTFIKLCWRRQITILFMTRVPSKKNWLVRMVRMSLRLIRPRSASLHSSCPTSLLLTLPIQAWCWDWRAIIRTLSLRSTERPPALCRKKMVSSKPSLTPSTRTQPVSAPAWTSTTLLRAMKTWPLHQLETILACPGVFQRAQLTPFSTRHRTESNNIA